MIFTEKEIYELDGAKQDLPGFNEKYINIVDYILKITDEIWEQRAVWVIYDTYANDILIHSAARQIKGVDEVVSGTIKTLASFPDRKMKGETVIWSRNKCGDFFSSHRIASTATNTGSTEFGAATGKKVFFRTIADCAIRENKIFEEWLVRDNLYIIEQLGFNAIEMAKRDQRYKNRTKARNEKPKKAVNGKQYFFDLDKPAELIHSLYENVWSKRDFEQLANYYHNLAKIHSICDKELLGYGQLKGYLENIFATLPNADVEVQRITCNELDGKSEVAVRWQLRGTHLGDGLFGPASGKEIELPGISHYTVKDGKIHEEWMVFDGYDALCQIYADINIETTSSVYKEEGLNRNNKKRTIALIKEMNEAGADKGQLSGVFKKYFSKDIILNITKPFEEIKGIDGYAGEFWLPLMKSFPDLENQTYILIGGEYEGRNYVSCTGNFVGTWEKNWLGIPATNQPVWLRYAAHFLFSKGKIVKAWYFFDILDVMRQAGFNFLPAKGIEWVPPIPMTGDGIVDYPTDEKEGQKTLALTNAMLDALGEYDGKTLESMGQERFWDVKSMMWYGPSGIGTTRGLKGFQNNHQIPFLKGFPDRGITPKKGKDHFTQIGDGNYSCDFGFPAMYGTHNGDGWLGLNATGNRITLRVVDYWRREEDRLKENWVFIDLVDVLEQLGIDVFKLMHKEIKNSKNGQE